MNKEKVIPVRHGGPYSSDEAYANLETGQIEDVAWDSGPSNAFNTSGGKIISMPLSEQGRENYDKIFRKEEEEDGEGND